MWSGSVGVPDSFLPEICALFGQPVAGNPMQFMMERAFEKHGLDWRYLSFEVAPDALGYNCSPQRVPRYRVAEPTDRPVTAHPLDRRRFLRQAGALCGVAGSGSRSARADRSWLRVVG